jgi:hypothetical protein
VRRMRKRSSPTMPNAPFSIFPSSEPWPLSPA